MAQLYGVSVSAINQHLKTIFNDGELIEEQVIKNFLITATDGKITDIYATALDYNPNATATKRFYSTVQNIVEQPAELVLISVSSQRTLFRRGVWHNYACREVSELGRAWASIGANVAYFPLEKSKNEVPRQPEVCWKLRFERLHA